ncbi:TetR/AcrR family transcriptional regulator [Fuscibacter oryzae]|uniref:TetR/AcrR family transcriptional regulator n=1 Tax=Fuscibacter oryzae TaxID=2803939 RepID=UPI002E2A60F5|nr:TetR/AcrR family transcriptional regulator [Fuscibacter oryzae]
MSDAENARASIGARRNPETEAAVLQAAAELIREQGYAALTMEAVCKRARAGKATLYRWWPSKAHLLLALVSRSKQEMELPDTGTLRGDLTAYLDDLLARWRGDDGSMPMGPLVRVLYVEAADNAELGAALLEERRDRWQLLDQILTAARARGEVSPRLGAERAKQLAMALPIYLLMIGRLPAPGETAALVDDILPSFA